MPPTYYKICSSLEYRYSWAHRNGSQVGLHINLYDETKSPRNYHLEIKIRETPDRSHVLTNHYKVN